MKTPVIWVIGVVSSILISWFTTGLEPDDLLKFYSHEKIGYVVIFIGLLATFFIDRKINGKKNPAS
jgi:hypothetical protein